MNVYLLLLEIRYFFPFTLSGKTLRVVYRREGRVVFERMILDKSKDGRQTSSEVKSGRSGLVLGWLTTFKQKNLTIFYILTKSCFSH